MTWRAALVLLLLAISCPAAHAHTSAKQRLTAQVDGTSLTVFTYRPSCEPRGIILVFHGIARNARHYRDATIPLADAACALVYAPQFDAARFPPSAYQHGGVTPDRATLTAAPVAMVPGLIRWAQARSGSPLPTMLLGHSAGAQFLSRVAAYVPTAARAIVLADPSTYVMPDPAVAAPFGGGFTSPDPGWLAAYLSRPVFIVLGANDVTDNHHLSETPQARAQGSNRLTRGQTAYALGQAAARRIGRPCAWQKAIVPGVGHDAAAMFASSQVRDIARAVFRSP